MAFDVDKIERTSKPDGWPDKDFGRTAIYINHTDGSDGYREGLIEDHIEVAIDDNPLVFIDDGVTESDDEQPGLMDFLTSLVIYDVDEIVMMVDALEPPEEEIVQLLNFIVSTNCIYVTCVWGHDYSGRGLPHMAWVDNLDRVCDRWGLSEISERKGRQR